MTRRLKRKLSDSNDQNRVIASNRSESSDDEGLHSNSIRDLNWTMLPDDTVIQLFSCLNYRDRASLSSTCRTFRKLGSSPCLWESLDLRFYKFDMVAAESLSSRSKYLDKLRFRGAESAAAVISLQARLLREICGDYCCEITDATLSMIAARHEMLESLQLGPNACKRISSDAIKAISLCCPKLRKLHLSGVQEVSEDAINALARNCGQLVEVAFMDSEIVDGVALGSLASLQFLSVSGTINVKWGSSSEVWSKMPKLVGVDVSRTDIGLNSIMRLMSVSQTLKVLLALDCPVFEAEVDSYMTYAYDGRVLLTAVNDIFMALDSLSANTTQNENKPHSSWRKLKNGDTNLQDIITWVEYILSHSLLRIAESSSNELDVFWQNQGAGLLLNLMQSSQDDVRERAATTVAFVVINDFDATVNCQRVEALMRDGGIQLLLGLARSCQEGLQSEAAKVQAIASLSIDSKVAQAIAEIGGINVLTSLAMSMNRLIAEEAAGGLWNLSVEEEHKGVIVEAGAVKALVHLIFKWSPGSEEVLERAAGTLANLVVDDKCCNEVALAGGIDALVMLAKYCEFQGVQEQAVRALCNLAGHEDNYRNNAAFWQESGIIEALVQLTCSVYEGVRQEAAGALWNLSSDEKNREAIAAVGGITALVSLIKSCTNSSQVLQERAAGAIWGLSVSQANSVAIGQGGGIAPLIVLACSDVEDVYETAVGALWNLAFCPSNALRIVEDGGVPILARLSSSSISKLARFMAALAMAYMFDGRLDASSSEGTIKTVSVGLSQRVILDEVRRMAMKHIRAFIESYYNPQTFANVMVSSAPTALEQVAEEMRIAEAANLKCSVAEIGRFIAMLRNPSPVLKSCSAFALLQFTLPGTLHAVYHTRLLEEAGAPRVLRAAAAATTAPTEAKIFVKIVLRNLQRHHLEMEASS